MKKVLCVLLLIISLLTTFVSCDISSMFGKHGVIYEKSECDTYAKVVGYRGTAKEVVIDAEYEGLPVTTIDARAFSHCDKLKSIEIPETVTNIGDGAFTSCYQLSSIVIPDGVTSIGDSAFWFCSSLHSVVIPNNVTSIGRYAFANSGIESVLIHDNITNIENQITQ